MSQITGAAFCPSTDKYSSAIQIKLYLPNSIYTEYKLQIELYFHPNDDASSISTNYISTVENACLRLEK